MSDLERFGEELRNELGRPPASFVDRQRLRLRGLDLSPQTSRTRPLFTMAAVVLGVVLAGGTYLWTSNTELAHIPGSQDEPSRLTGKSTAPQASPPSIEQKTEAAIWLGADSESSTHRLLDGSLIEVKAGGRGRIDQTPELGTRFDLHAGTATFKVQKQTGRPFSVVAGEYRVLVVGTQFTTTFVPPHQLEVAVVDGVVEVELPGRPEAITVKQGEVLEVSGHEFSLHDHAAPSRGEETRELPFAQKSAKSWRELYREGMYQDACENARKRSLSQLRARLGAEELVDLAGALRFCGDSGEALLTLEALRNRFSASPQAHDALFLLGRIQATEKRTASAIAYFESYLKTGGRFTPEVLGRLIELNSAQGNRAQASEYASKYLRIAPQGPYRRLAESVAPGL